MGEKEPAGEKGPTGELEQLRNEIGAINCKMLAQFARRMAVVDKVAEYKANTQSAVAVFVPEQENKQIENARMQIENAGACMPQGMGKYADALLRTLMRLSRERQYELVMQRDNNWALGKALSQAARTATMLAPPDVRTVAFPGTMQSHSGQAASLLYPDATLIPVRSFEGAACQVVDGNVDAAVLPLENSTAGTVEEVYALLEKHQLFIQASCDIQIRHALMAIPGQASNTECNQTRFIAVGRTLTLPFDAERVSLLIQAPNVAGTLASILNIFSDLGIDLAKVQSRPIPKRPWDYSFYIDFMASPDDSAAHRALYQIDKETTKMRLLGWYPCRR